MESDYQKVKKACIRQKILDPKNYHALYIKGKLPQGAPENPEEFDEFEGWWIFLGQNESSNLEYTFREAMEHLQKWHANINTGPRYQQAFAMGELSPRLPEYPPHSYSKDWVSWSVFLGHPSRRTTFADIDTASSLMRPLRLRTRAEFNEYKKKNSLPDGCPSAPQTVYGEEFKAKGGWKWYLGNEMMDYIEAQNFIRSVSPRITNFSEFREFVESDKKPKNFPAQPSSYSGYRNYWVSYPVFFGVASDKKSGEKQLQLETAISVVEDLIAQLPELKSPIKQLLE